MVPAPRDDLVRMGWPDFAAFLEETARRDVLEEVLEARLPGWFDRALRDQLDNLAKRSASLRATLPTLGNVVFLHGVMCADLETDGADGGAEMLWLDLPKLAAGGLARLKLSPDGRSEADPSVKVRVAGVNKAAYAPTLLWLQARWNVLPFAYDWRRDVDQAADSLAEFLETHFPGEPVHLVAHSMGGLVARNFIRRHGDLWRRLKDPRGVRGGRLVQLGTPNLGTFLASQVLSGQSEIIWTLDQADLRHDLATIREIAGTFVSVYQFLPVPDRPGGSSQALFRREIWGDLPVSEDHLARSLELQRQLEDPATLDPERLCYVAGYGFRTPGGVKLGAPGTLEHSFTYRGDGITSLELGPPPGVPTWYLYANHLDLTSSPRVLQAVDDLLITGDTALLAKRPVPVWLFQTRLARVAKELGRWWLGREVREVAREANAGTADEVEVQRTERVMLETFLGERRVLRRLRELEAARWLPAWPPLEAIEG